MYENEKKKITIKKGDITKEKVDVIVNAANTSLLGGGGVDGAIHKAAGPQLLSECCTIGGCPTGEARVTKGYNLPAKNVIHTVGPIWKGGTHNEEQLLQNAYKNSLEEALKLNAKTIAIPAISTGVYRFPPAKAAEIALKTTAKYLQEHDTIQEIRLICYTDESLKNHETAKANL